MRSLTNPLDALAQEIVDIYKQRCRIELFFLVMKQIWEINRFLDRSENALRIQIAIALIAYLSLRAARDIANIKHSFLELVRLVHADLMPRKDISRKRQNPTPPPPDRRQLSRQYKFNHRA